MAVQQRKLPSSAPPIIDLERHRQKRRRASLRSHWPSFLILGLLVFSLGLWYLLTQTPHLRIHEVTVSGNTRVDAASILEQARVDLGDRPWHHLPWQVRKRVLQTDPWLKDVTVTLPWPFTAVHIYVTERTPTYVLSLQPERDTENRFVLVDEDGVILEELARPMPNTLPIISGIHSPELQRGATVAGTQLQDAKALLAWMAPSLRDAISELHIDASGQVTLFLENRLEVRWGLVPVEERDKAIQHKLAILGGLLKESLETPKPICIIDLRDEKLAVMKECP